MAITPARPASAEVYTCGQTSPTNYHDGYVQPSGATGSNEYEGAYADITVQYGAVCDTDTSSNNFTNSYVMIASGDLSGWAQVGFIRWYNHVTVQFAQHHYSGQSTYPTKYGTTQLTSGTTYGYGEHWNSSTKDEEDKINSANFWTTSFDPFDEWTTPFDAQYDGEAYYRESDMPGDSANPTTFANVQGQSYSTNNFVSVPCNYLQKGNDGSAKRTDGEAWYNQPSGSCPGFKIYTDTAGG